MSYVTTVTRTSVLNTLAQAEDQDYNDDTYDPNEREEGSVNDLRDELNRKRRGREQPPIVPM